MMLPFSLRPITYIVGEYGDTRSPPEIILCNISHVIVAQFGVF